MGHYEPLRPCSDRLGALFSDLLSVGLLPRAVLRKILGNCFINPDKRPTSSSTAPPQRQTRGAQRGVDERSWRAAIRCNYCASGLANYRTVSARCAIIRSLHRNSTEYAPASRGVSDTRFVPDSSVARSCSTPSRTPPVSRYPFPAPIGPQ